MRIFLVGFMGAGKSHLGKLWANKNQLTFFDLDELIEAEENQNIAIIFEKKGEAYFREKEAATLRTTLQYQNAIIATGGGTPCFFNNMQWMLANGTVVFLNESTDKIIENINKGEQIRPLLLNLNNHEKQLFIANKLTERLPFYNQSNIILPTLDLSENGFIKIKNFIENKKQMHKYFLKLASILGCITVIIGAFAAHTIKARVAPDTLLIFETGVRYQMYHTIALFITAIVYKDYPYKNIIWAGRLFITGIILFSGSLYILTFIIAVDADNFKWVGAVTPFGGVAFVAGWLLLAKSFFSNQQVKK